ncbi:MAG TPA: ribosome silencing factor [Blastocatellia bacterium]|jgi:ribosome-associated protein|nr:ribosome silencing factor [Blastocatellia bacterium]
MSKVAISTAVNEEMEQNRMESDASAGSAEDRLIFEQVKVAARAADEKKAQGVVVLRLSAITEFTDYFVICAGNSTRQTQAIADAVIEELKRLKTRPLHMEGYNNAEWILIDYGAFVVHIFTEESRSFYDLERLWRDAEKVVVSG